MKKKYLILGIVAVAAVAAYVFTPSLDTIVRRLVNKYGSQVTGTDVDLKGFSLSLSSGEGKISQITIANPKNYSAPYLFKLDEISIKVNLKSLTSDTIIIDEIKVRQPEITYEMISLTQNNVSEILKNIENYGKPSESAAADAKPQKETKATKSDSAGKKVIIKNLLIDKGNIDVIAALPGKTQKLSVALPSIKMQGIGESRHGESIPETISKVIGKILTTASQTVVKSNAIDLKGIAQENLNNVVGGVKDRVKSIGIFGK